MQVIKLKIDVTKIDKTRLYKGDKGTYLNAVLFLSDQQDQYGNNGMIVEDVTKQERDAGVKGTILGNAKLPSTSQQPRQRSAPPPQPRHDDQEGDMPF